MDKGPTKKPSPKDKTGRKTDDATAGGTLGCINIDCVFNSSLDPEKQRNTCSHPNVKVETSFADITIAICSEFRSKKDYRFAEADKDSGAPHMLVELKSGEKSEIKGKPEVSYTPIEKVTTKDLEEGIKRKDKDKKPHKPATDTALQPGPEPKIIHVGDTEPRPPSEVFNLTDNPKSNFLILKRLYRPYMKRGITFSIIAHFIFLWLFYLIFVSSEENYNKPLEQRIVVVADIETPKFEPPLLDKPEDENTGEVKDERPRITPRRIRPNIIRPKDDLEDSTEIARRIQDSLKLVTDSLLALQNLLDTSRLIIPDSLRNNYDESAVGLKLWYPMNWTLRDNRSVNLAQEEFKGVIINTDSLSEDPGAVSIFIQIDDPRHSSYNRAVFKNTFLMDDSTVTAFSTDPTQTGAKRINYKFFLFADPTGEKNIFVNTETKMEFFDKYKKFIEAIIRSISIVQKPKNP